MNLYIPVIAHKSGDYIAERDLSACTREQVIRDIYSGEIEDVTQIWCIDTERGTFLEVIKDIAIDVGQRTFDERCDSWSKLAAWLSKHRADFYSSADEEDYRPDYIEHALGARQLGVGRYA